MAIQVVITYDNPDPEDCPQTFAESIALQRELIHGEVVATITPYIRQAATPSVDQQDLVWHKIDVDGRPIGTFHFYSGAWRREYSGRKDEMRYFRGDPGEHFDETGRGLVGGEWDGFALANGNNGTPNWSDKFIVCAKMDDLAVGYSGNTWKTNVSGESTENGGANEITLTEDTTFRKPLDAIKMSNWQADGNSQNSGGGLWGLGSAHTLLPADDGNETPDAIPVLPPYVVSAICLWVGYI